MSWSLGEIRALAVKASRGAGFDWGMAEEAGFAVRWLEAAGLPGVAALNSYLSSRHQDPCAKDSPVCPLALGTQLLDQQRLHPLDLGYVSHPLLLVAFLGAYAEVPCQLVWRDALVRAGDQKATQYTREATIHIGQARINSLLPLDIPIVTSAYCHTLYSDNNSWTPASVTRLTDGNTEVVRALSMWASKTYAPSTEQSRLSGAGAGVSDND